MESSTELHSKKSHSKDKLEVPINEINDESRGGYITGSDIKFKTTMLKIVYVIMLIHTYLLREQ